MTPFDNTKKAIEAALNHRWDEAIKLNEELLKNEPTNIEGLLRLGYAFLKNGLAEKSKKAYKKVLALDKYNYVALKNIERLASLPKRALKPGKKKDEKEMRRMSPSLYLEEPGRTKTVHLTNVATASILSEYEIGDIVYLQARKRSIEVRDDEKTYIGELPDDVSFRLLRLLEAGNTYNVLIKGIRKKEVTVFIREISRGKKFRNQPTFLPSTNDLYEPPREAKKAQPEDDLDE